MSKNKSFFRASAEDFKKIPGSPIAYWVSDGFRNAFALPRIESLATPSQGMSTCDVDRFVRFWSEVALSRTNIRECQNHAAWIRYNKGGQFRKWFGNREYVVFWNGNGADLKNAGAALRNQDQYFKRFLAWTKISSGVTGFRIFENDFLFDGAGGSLFLRHENKRESFLAFLNSCVATKLLTVISPTVNFNESHIGALPIDVNIGIDIENIKRCVMISRCDWDTYETSWDFAVNPLVALCDSLRSFCQHPCKGIASRLAFGSGDTPQGEGEVRSAECGVRSETNSDSSEASLTLRQDQETRNVSGASDKSEFPLEKLYASLREKWAKDCEEMRRLETENNRIFIEAYGLQDELTPEVPWNEITLTCNPWYRYGVKDSNSDSSEASLTLRQDQETRNVSGASDKSELKMPRNLELEERLRGDTVKELVSYAVGCMMGRYSLEKPGLILADQGSTIKDYYDTLNSDSSEASLTLRQDQETRNVSGASDKSEFLFTPDEDGIIPILDNDWFEDDIVTRFKAFIKAAFGEEHFFENMAWIEEALGKDIRSYFTKDFYKDHLQRYQNRPIYWLFQSPKGAFRALVYMHRYKPDMVGGVLGYLRSLQTKVDNQLDVAMRVGADESKSASERVRANKDAVKYAKAKKELDEYEKNVLYPLSTERIEIDLDDGVKVNYRKFGIALKKVAALEG